MTYVPESWLENALNTPRHTSISFVCQITQLFDRKSTRSLKIDSRVQIAMRWTLAVSMDRKVFVAIVDSEVIGQQIVPNVARMVNEAKVRMASGGARKASQAKGKLMMAKENAKVACGKHARHLKGIAITVGNGVTWKRIVSQKPTPRVVKARVLAASMNPRQVDQKTLQLADLVCARLETNVMTGSGTVAK